MKHKASRINELATVLTVGAIHELPLQKDLPEGWAWKGVSGVWDELKMILEELNEVLAA